MPFCAPIRAQNEVVPEVRFELTRPLRASVFETDASAIPPLRRALKAAQAAAATRLM